MKKNIASFLQKEKKFLLILGVLSICSLFIHSYFTIAAWFGFAVASYSAIGNDSIQTLGTFLASNKKYAWWKLWIFIAGIFVIIHWTGWYIDSGDISFGRLQKIARPSEFSFLHIFAPVLLLALTRFRVPISTTFLILSVFATGKTIDSMLAKTFIGYVLAFVIGIVFFGAVYKFLRKFFTKPISDSAEKYWRVFQWLSTAFLWGAWLMQDIANIAVFLPRSLSFLEMIFVSIIGVSLLGVLLYQRGGRIQDLVQEKKNITDVRAATLIDLVLAFIFVYFKKMNSIPMSTTWIFLGLMAGREIILAYLARSKKDSRRAFFLMGKDICFASIGIVVSLLLAFLI